MDRTLLLVDDDLYGSELYADALRDHGYTVLRAASLTQAKCLIKRSNPSLVVIDVMMPTGEGEDDLSARAGFASGVVLGRWIKRNCPHVKFLALTNSNDKEAAEWFATHSSGFYRKTDTSYDEFPRIIRNIEEGESPHGIRTFIVHGHDEGAKLSLKNFLQNNLHLPEPTILHERPSIGRTLLDKLQDEGQHVDIVFVLLTPDDLGGKQGDPNEVKRRARQNVILELGYFLGLLRRRRGRVLLLHKGGLELPSDLGGLIYIDIEDGIEAAGETIRREISAFLRGEH